LIKCPSGARQAGAQLKDLGTPGTPIIKYKLNIIMLELARIFFYGRKNTTI
jgi:hypothetical protein